jgi:hypothetical protein
MGYGDTETSIANRALSSIGNRSTIASLTEQSNEAIYANQWFNSTRDELLRMAPWDCSFNYEPLVGITATPGTPENPSTVPTQWNKTLPPPGWAYEYQYPSDCLRACFIVPQFMTGFASGVPITTAITGGAPSYWNGPPAKFKVIIDQPITALSAALSGGGGQGYAVNDTINLDPNNGSGVPAILRVTAVGTNGAIVSTNFLLSGSYSPLAGGSPTNPVQQGSTSGAGSGAAFNLTLSTPSDRRVVITNQEFAIMALVKQVTDVTIWDSQFTQAFAHLLGSRLIFSLTGDKGLANERIKYANEMIIAARNTDANEGQIINDVTPDFIRIRGIDYPTDMGWTPNINYDWGQLLTLY